MNTIFKGLAQALIITVGGLLTVSALASGDAAAGKGKTAVCATCHGADGNSPSGAFPTLAGLGEKYLLKQMRDIRAGDPAKNGRAVPEMTGMLTGLSDQDLQDIAAYYDSQQRQLTGAQGDAKSLALGEKIFRAGNLETGVAACTGCHSPTANGNAPAGYPALGGQHAAYIAKQLRAFRTGAHALDDPAARVNDESQIMRGVAAHLNDQEINALADFIAGLR